ncbi:hypothetical protein, partial [Sphingomonas sp.]|uniref:hypothetical protein n=1 Tax=Sphingomonas sp. TaxID=28214 RepID=UPI003B3B1AAF
ISVEAAGMVGADQRFIWEITPVEGEWMQVQAIGGQLVALDKMMRAVARQDGGKVGTYLERVETRENGAIAFHIAVLPIRKKAQPKGAPDAPAS